MGREPVPAFVAVGANLGDARATVLQAFEDLGQLPHTRLRARSRLGMRPCWRPACRPSWRRGWRDRRRGRTER